MAKHHHFLVEQRSLGTYYIIIKILPKYGKTSPFPSGTISFRPVLVSLRDDTVISKKTGSGARSEFVSQRYGSVDSDPYQNATDP